MMPLFQAEELAERLVEQMRPHCTRIQVAGSIRRQKPSVKDIEIVALPRWEERPNPMDLFGGEIPVNCLYADWSPRADLQWLQGCKPEGRYWKALLPEGINLDLFLPAPENWGIILAIRTGSAEFSQALVTYAKESGFPVRDGALHGRDGRELATPTERAVFELLGLQWVEPECRTGAAALRPCRRAAA